MTVKKPLVINQPEVGKLIHELRLATGLTQEQFAAELGVTYSTVNRWERGRSKPLPMAMQQIQLRLDILHHCLVAKIRATKAL
ncbi:MAG: helix-turn-helix transcriptional regulator [Stigonema ocellatum SAG 48.90 = DSM 106950]|nr:helix-turn-helix transcriptional regulator [Stigonema ocellatum SAG 48.90 = DSM 106950]